MIKKQMKEERGITLIALVVTIVVLLILAGVSIAMLTGDNGIITQANKSKENTRGAEVKERVLLAASENGMTEYSKDEWTNKVKLVDKLETEKKLTDEEADSLLGRDGKEETDIIQIGDIIIDFSILNRDDEETEEITGTVTISEPVWENGTATVTLSTDSGYDIEYKNGETWTKGTTVTGLKHDDTVYARLTNGSSYTEPQQLHIKDNTAPTITIESAMFFNSWSGTDGFTIRISQVLDAESGIGENPTFTCYLKHQDETEYLEEPIYSGQEVESLILYFEYNEAWGTIADGDYLKIEVQDIAGNKGMIETTIRAVTEGCFVAGTKVSTPSGLRNIEDIKIGDTVYSFNEESNKVEEQKVTKTFVFEKEEINTITFENGEKIQNTPIHPYYVVGKGWTETKELNVGDEILTQDGKTVKVANIELQQGKATKVYNIKVENNHNYFVGITKLLVHNKA